MAKTEAEICKECKGNCCKSTGCSLSPEDMIREIRNKSEGAELSTEAIENWLKDSNCALDSFGYPGGRLFYVRMRHKCFTFIGIDAMGECAALTDTGCLLTYEERPKGGRMLIASEDHHCRQNYTREMMVSDWLPYQDRLKQIWEKWYEQFTKDGTFDRCEEEYMKFQRARREQMMALQGER